VTGQFDPGSLQNDPQRLFPAFIPILLPFAVLIVPLLDFGLAVFRRLRAGKSPFSADRKHLHHRLLDMGHSHFHAVLIFYGWTAVASVGTLLFLFIQDWWWPALITAVGLVVCVAQLAPPSTVLNAPSFVPTMRMRSSFGSATSVFTSGLCSSPATAAQLMPPSVDL